ncbi:MAG: iron-containing alcohol dehydrogenase [Gammaproteobacteria bacterium]|nr:iron-containing alcohol dehydrogenase [Gammaproteobacteria bacterium]
MFDFSIARLPRIEFGAGTFNKLPEKIAGYGSSILMVTGGKSFRTSDKWHHFVEQLNDRGIIWEHCTVAEEPSPQLIDEIVKAFADYSFEVVVGIGGGSALDAAKAIAGLLKVQRSVMDYLEGVGPELTYEGPAVPFIAVPTTAGTGSEATKNAVLSVQGEHGFKKSFRHEKLVAQYAVVDPDLLSTCPPSVIAANGMDALTQLIESYVSLNANVFTDALAISGLRAARDGLLPLFHQCGQAHDAREKMAYAALISGITLAQVGLGSVHGLASPLGAFYLIPHGVACGTLVASATEINIKSMLARDPRNRALEKYMRVAEVLCEKRIRDRQEAWDQLVELLRDWTQQLQLPLLSYYGLNNDTLDKVVANSRGSSMKTNPIVLTDQEIKNILLDRL